MDDYSAFQQLEDVDQELKRIVERQRGLLIHRNTLLPISRLPPEIISLVFRLIAPGPENKCLAFSQVCHHWRELALNNPQLWRSPIMAVPDLAVEMAERANGVPLNIYASSTGTGGIMLQRATVLATVIRSSAVRRLMLVTSSGSPIQTMSVLTDELALTSCDTLRYLDLQCDMDTEVAGTIGHPDCVFPLLRYLRLKHYVIPWSAGCYSNLLVLEITLKRRRGQGSHYMSIGFATNVLLRSPNLTKLVLTNVMYLGDTPDHPASLSELTAKVRLPNLTDMELHDTPYHLQCLFSSIETPNLSKLVVYVRTPDEQERVVKVQPLLRLIADNFAQSTIRTFQSVKFQVSTRYHIVKATGHEAHSSNSQDELQLSLHVPRSSVADILEVWTALSHRFSLDGLEKLMLRHSDPNDARLVQPLCSLIATNPTLKRLTVVSYAYIPFLECLMADPTSHFRNIETLHVREANMTYTPPVIVNGQQMSGLRRLAKVLKSLKNDQRPISKVNLHSCSVETPASEVFAKFSVVAQVFDEIIPGENTPESIMRGGGIFRLFTRVGPPRAITSGAANYVADLAELDA